MPLKSPKGLFVYQMGAMRDVEMAGATLLGHMRKNVRDEALGQLLHRFEQDKSEQMANFRACLELIDGSPLQTTSRVIDGLRERFQEFTKMQPAPEILDLIALGIAVRLAHLGIVGYEELVALAEIIEMPECKPSLRANLDKKKEHLALLERRRSEMGQQLRVAV